MITPSKTMVMGDYPYYRDDVNLWEAKLSQIKNLGVDVLTCYLPWRHHHVTELAFSFDGNSDVPNRNIKHFIKLVSKMGLLLIIRPGPFIHAEVELGGIPDQFSPSFNNSINALCGINNEEYIYSEDKLLPDMFDKLFLQQSSIWFEAVAREIVANYGFPAGPIIGVQIGNEGIYSDTNWMLGKADLSKFYAAYYNDNSRKDLDYRAYKIYLEHFSKIILKYTKTVKIIFSIAAPSSENPLSVWLNRVKPLVWNDTSSEYAYSSWQGNAIKDINAFKSIMISAKRMDGINIEENAGFTWNDKDYIDPHTFIYHALLHFASGAKGISLYPVVATNAWDKGIEVNSEYIFNHPERAKYYAAPYGEASPVDFNGMKNKSYDDIQIFIKFIRAYYSNASEYSSGNEFLIAYPEKNLILDNQDIDLGTVIDKFIELGLDFDLSTESNNISEKIYTYTFDFEKNKYSIKEILSIIQEKKLNYLSGGEHVLFYRKNALGCTDCIFIFSRKNTPLKLEGILLGKKINVALPNNGVLVLLINSNNGKLKATYLKTPKAKKQYQPNLLLDEKKYQIKENITIYEYE